MATAQIFLHLKVPSLFLSVAKRDIYRPRGWSFLVKLCARNHSTQHAIYFIGAFTHPLKGTLLTIHSINGLSIVAAYPSIFASKNDLCAKYSPV
jgi:hypothetical protein